MAALRPLSASSLMRKNTAPLSSLSSRHGLPRCHHPPVSRGFCSIASRLAIFQMTTLASQCWRLSSSHNRFHYASEPAPAAMETPPKPEAAPETPAGASAADAKTDAKGTKSEKTADGKAKEKESNKAKFSMMDEMLESWARTYGQRFSKQHETHKKELIEELKKKQSTTTQLLEAIQMLDSLEKSVREAEAETSPLAERERKKLEDELEKAHRNARGPAVESLRTDFIKRYGREPTQAEMEKLVGAMDTMAENLFDRVKAQMRSATGGAGLREEYAAFKAQAEREQKEKAAKEAEANTIAAAKRKAAQEKKK